MWKNVGFEQRKASFFAYSVAWSRVFVATQMKLYIRMGMCYVYAVVPQQGFIGHNISEAMK